MVDELRIRLDAGRAYVGPVYVGQVVEEPKGRFGAVLQDGRSYTGGFRSERTAARAAARRAGFGSLELEDGDDAGDEGPAAQEDD